MKGKHLAVIALVVLVLGFMVRWTPIQDKWTAEQGAPNGQSGTSFPGLVAPVDGEVDSRAPARRIQVLVKESEQSEATLLAIGELQFDVDDLELAVPVRAGVAEVPASLNRDSLLEAIVRGQSGEILHSHVAGADQLMAFAYPGYFIDGEFTPGADIEVRHLAGVPEVPMAGDLPPRADRLERVPVSEPVRYVRALTGPDSLFYVRVANGAWKRIDHGDHRPGDVVEVHAGPPGGTVIFEFPELAIEAKPRLIVRREGQVVMRPKVEELGADPVTGWTPGSYSAFMTRSTSDSESLALSEVVRFDVRPGLASTVKLEPRGIYAVEPEEPGALAGVVAFEAWDLVEPWHTSLGFTLRITRESEEASLAFDGLAAHKKAIFFYRMEMLRSPDSGDPAWSWDAGEYPPGSYRLTIEPLGWSSLAQVAPRQSTFVEITVPEQARTLVNVRSTGGELLTDFTSFLVRRSASGTEPSGDPLTLRILPDEEGNPNVIASPGSYDLSIVRSGKLTRKPVELLPGWNSVTFIVEDPRSAMLELTDGEGRIRGIDASRWEEVRLRSVEGGEEAELLPMHVTMNGKALGHARARVVFDTPGPYRLSGLPLPQGEEILHLDDGATVPVRVLER